MATTTETATGGLYKERKEIHQEICNHWVQKKNDGPVKQARQSLGSYFRNEKGD